MNNLPFAYAGVLLTRAGDVAIELDEPGWKSREEIPNLIAFTLKPKPAIAGLPTVSVDLSPTEDGRRDLVYFSRVCGKMSGSGPNGQMLPLFRLYCLGWKANIRGKTVESRVWI